MRYYIRDSEAEKGPYYSKHLQVMFDQGAISPKSHVRREDSTTWLPATEIASLLEHELQVQESVERKERDSNRTEVVHHYIIAVLLVVAASALVMLTQYVRRSSVTIDPHHAGLWGAGIGSVFVLAALLFWGAVFKGKRGSWILFAACLLFSKSLGSLVASFVVRLF